MAREPRMSPWVRAAALAVVFVALTGQVYNPTTGGGGGGSGTVTSVTCGAGLSGGTFTTSGTCNIAGGGVTNAMLANSGLTLGSTALTLGATTTTVAGLTLTSPTFTSPALGTPASGVATNLTGTAASLTAGNVTTNANLTGPVTSSGNATAFATMTSNAFLTGNGTALPNRVAITGLVKGNGASAPAAYGGTSCTNQFPRSLDLNGAATCASVANADLAGSIAASNLVGTDIATVGALTAGSINWAGNIATSGTISTSNATATSSPSTGAAVVTGGLGVGGSIQVGANVVVAAGILNFGTQIGVNSITLYDGGGAGLRWGMGINAGDIQLFAQTQAGNHWSFNGGGDLQPDGTNEWARVGNEGVGITDTSAAFPVTIKPNSSTALTAGRTLTLDMKDVAHTLAFNATANTITFPNTASYTLIGSGDTGTVTSAMQVARAATMSLPSNPTGTTSTTGVMAGLAGAITPTRTGTILVIINGNGTDSLISDGCIVQIRTGTGGAPSNGGGLVGTTRGNQVSWNDTAAGAASVFSVAAVVSGATLSTALWIDLAFAAITAGTCTLSSITVNAVEL
jgi:hypothetical protein